MSGSEIPGYWTAGRYRVAGASAAGWVNDFGSKRLSELVHEAVDQNYNLKSGRSRISQVLERSRIANAGRLPKLDGGINSSRSQTLRGAAFRTVTATNHNLLVDFSWEADIWGRVKNLRDAQLDLAVAETNIYEWTRLSLAANVVKTTLEIAESRQQIGITRRNLKSLQTNLDILDAKLEAGGGDDRTALEISLSRADIARSKSSILVEKRQIDAASRSLEILLGRYPKGQIKTLSTLPRVGRKIPAGLPSELLLRRPDLIAAEYQVDAKLKDLAASRKALLPAIRLTGRTGTSTTRVFQDLFDIKNLIWNVGGNLSAPLFAGGRLRSDIRLDEHERDEFIANYANKALTAFREVETALSAEGYLIKQTEALQVAVTEARRAEKLSQSQYEKGLVDIITLLESQRRYFGAQSSLLQVRLQLLQNRVDLYLALGGDFDHPVIVEK